MTGGSADRTRRLTLAAIGGGLIVRLLIAALTPLLPDEAYYWEWSRHLAAGYFDHPPAVAWLIAAGTALLGPTSLGVRLGAVIAGTGAIGCVVAIARRLGGDEAGLRAALLLLCMPLVIPGLAVATTDAPALFAIAAALLCIVVAVDPSSGAATSAAWWIAAGAALGMGLLAKLTVGIVGAAIGTALLFRPSLRRQLQTPGPWLAVLCAAIIATPLIWWNAHHDWISVRFQLSHGLGAPTRGSVVGRELSLVGSQFALVSPGIFVLALASAWQSLTADPASSADGSRTGARDGRFLLAAIGSIIFAFFVYSALRRPVEANWPAPALLAVIPLAAAASPPLLRRLWRPSVAIGACLVLIALVQLALPILPLPASRDPVARAYGWSALAMAADSTARASESRRRVWLGADRYQDAAEIALHAPGNPTVFALSLGGRRNQYELWPSFAQSASRGDGLVVALDTGSSDVAERLRPHFAAAERRGRVALTRAGDTVSVRQLWSFLGWRGSWPTGSPGRR